MLDGTEFGNAHKWVFVSFSGGKDSVATLQVVREQYPDHIITALFCDTGDELPETYEYIKYFNKEVFPIIRLAQKWEEDGGNGGNGRRKKKLCKVPIALPVEVLRKEYVTVFDVIRDRHIRRPDVPPFPSASHRHCTQITKVDVFEKFIRHNVPFRERHLAVSCIGVRRAESVRRRSTPETAYDIQGGWDVWYPIVNFQLTDVLTYHRKYGIKVNPAYTIASRSNCVCCPLSDTMSIKRAVHRHGTRVIQNWVDLERETGYLYKSSQSVSDYEDAKETTLEVAESCTSGFCSFD